MDWKIKEEFLKLSPFLIGKPKQFVIIHGTHYCVRENLDSSLHPCTGCPYHENGCKAVKKEIHNSIVPPPRRAMAFEQTPFLVLLLKEGLDFRKDVPKDLWNTEYDDLCQDERNIHYLLIDLKHIFRSIKGQFRFYGTKEDFIISEYAPFFDCVDEYIPQHKVVSLDYSSVEPKINTMLSKEPKWIEGFEGTLKSVSRKIKF